MKRVHIQLQPARSPTLDVNRAIARWRQLGRDVRISEGDDDGLYFNIDFQADDLRRLWDEVRAVLQDVPGMGNAAIVACEGERGWTDYRLLHHFDPSEPLDTLD